MLSLRTLPSYCRYMYRSFGILFIFLQRLELLRDDGLLLGEQRLFGVGLVCPVYMFGSHGILESVLPLSWSPRDVS